MKKINKTKRFFLEKIKNINKPLTQAKEIKNEKRPKF